MEKNTQERGTCMLIHVFCIFQDVLDKIEKVVYPICIALNSTCMSLICPECKNSVDLSSFPNLAPGHVIECNTCGITLLVKEMNADAVTAEIVDEGK